MSEVLTWPLCLPMSFFWVSMNVLEILMGQPWSSQVCWGIEKVSMEKPSLWLFKKSAKRRRREDAMSNESHQKRLSTVQRRPSPLSNKVVARALVPPVGWRMLRATDVMCVCVHTM